MKKLGIINDTEVISATHPQSWMTAKTILNRVNEARGAGSIAFPGAIPGEGLLRQVPVVLSRGILEPLPHIVKTAEYYGLDNELAEHSLYLKYTKEVNHLRLLLRGMVVRQLLEMKCASQLQEEPWCDPKPTESFALEKEKLLWKYGHPDFSSGDDSIDHLRISEIHKYGAGPAYFRLTAKGESIKKDVKDKVTQALGVLQEA